LQRGDDLPCDRHVVPSSQPLYQGPSALSRPGERTADAAPPGPRCPARPRGRW
jgi:hypothetical protein